MITSTAIEISSHVDTSLLVVLGSVLVYILVGSVLFASYHAKRQGEMGLTKAQTVVFVTTIIVLWLPLILIALLVSLFRR